MKISSLPSDSQISIQVKLILTPKMLLALSGKVKNYLREDPRKSLSVDEAKEMARLAVIQMVEQSLGLFWKAE